MQFHIRTLLLSMALALTLTACDKVDENGDLGGMWQLLSQTRRDAPDVAVRTADDRIFFSFRNELLKTQCMSENEYFLSLFRHHGDSIFLDSSYAVPGDSLVSPEALARYGVDATGRFRVESLTSERLVLSNAESVLTFRKY